MGPGIAGGLFGKGCVWQAVTPYTTAKRRLYDNGKERGDAALEVHISDELKAREYPTHSAPELHDLSWVGDLRVRADAFIITGANGRVPHLGALSSFPVVTFGTPINGPLTLGYGAHFGLGMFLPVG